MNCSLLPLACLALPLSWVGAEGTGPRLPVRLAASEAASYRTAVASLMAMSEAEVLQIIPEQSGLYFTDCPNCEAGIQEGQFQGGKDSRFTSWDPAQPLVMKCAYCGHSYPSEKYPMAKTLEAHGPNGRLARYPYWEDAKGYRHYFGARIDDHRIRHMETMGWRLGRAYWLTKDPQYARRCALILQRFAAVFPGYCYHYDYPFQQKLIKDGNVEPKDFVPAFRIARWTWWAYMDVPARLVEAYDLIRGSGELEKLSTELGHDVAAEIEGAFADAVRQVMANPDDLTNMSPGMWADFIRAGWALQHPEWVHEAASRLERFVGTGFNYDGTWREGAPSYHAQVVGALQNVLQAAAGYSDPPGYRHPDSGRRFEALDLKAALPAVGRVGASLEQMRLPTGRYVPVHDTWSSNGGKPLTESRPWLLPALGHACLAGGEGEAQWQVHLTWSPGMGHAHADGLSLLLAAGPTELLSDLGYTHSRDRAWTLPTLAHNTVVIDHLDQTANRTTFGSLRFLDVANPGCQIVSVDNPQVYRGLASTYRRTLIAVNGDYVVDLFEVEGGRQHDYLLHGCTDFPGTVRAVRGGQPLATTPLATLLPEGTAFQEARNEGECGLSAKPGYAYGYLRDLQRVVDPLPAACTLEFTITDYPARTRADLVTQPGDELFLGRNPAIRGAQENDAGLRSCWRPFALLRRNGGSSRFATVLGWNPALALATRRQDLPGADLAIEVACGDRRDLVLLRPYGLHGEWQGQALAADAELAVIRGVAPVAPAPGRSGVPQGPEPVDGPVPGPGREVLERPTTPRAGRPTAGPDGIGATTPALTVVGGQVRWGGHAIVAAPVAPARLLAADRQAGTLTVVGEVLPPAGTVVLLDQAGERVSPFTVTKAEPDGANSRLTVAEGVGFDYDPATETSTFRGQPKTTHHGPHLLRQMPVAHRP